MKPLSTLHVFTVLFLTGCSVKSPITPVVDIPGVGIYTTEDLSDRLELWYEVWGTLSGEETVLTKENLVLNILPSAKSRDSFTSHIMMMQMPFIFGIVTCSQK